MWRRACYREEATLPIVKDEVQSPPFDSITTSSCIRQDSPGFYAILQYALGQRGLIFPLKCEKHPFSEDISDISEELKSIYSNLFSVEGDIFENCSFAWVQMRKIILEELFNSVQKLEKPTVLDVPPQVVSRVADIVAIAATMGVKGEWIKRILGEIAETIEHFNLLQEAQNLQKKIEELDSEREEAVRSLGQIDVDLVHKDYGIHTAFNYRIHLVRRPE